MKTDTTASLLKSFCHILKKSSKFSLDFDNNHFTSVGTNFKKQNQLRPHTYWPREVIWLVIVYFYNDFVSESNKSMVPLY